MNMELSETRRDLQIYLKKLGINIQTIWAISNMLQTDEESRGLIHYLPKISSEIYLTNTPKADEIILQKAIEIHLEVQD